MPSSPSALLVVGATGGIGRRVVAAAGGTASRSARPTPPRRIDYRGVAAVLQALDGRTPRLALMTSIDVSRRGAYGGSTGQLLDWKRGAERLVRASGAPYTIVRPGWFDAVGAGDDRLVLEQTDTGNGVIGRGQLAEVLVRSLLTETAAGRTFELFAEAGPAPTDWAGLFGALTADPAGGLEAASDAATLPPVGEEPPVVQDDPARLARCPDPAGGHCQYPERQALPRRRDRELPGARPRTGRARTRASNSHVRRR